MIRNCLRDKKPETLDGVSKKKEFIHLKKKKENNKVQPDGLTVDYHGSSNGCSRNNTLNIHSFGTGLW